MTLDRHTPGLRSHTRLGFGEALAMLDHNGDGRKDLTVGSRGVESELAEPTSGTLVTLLGRRSGFSAARSIWVDAALLGVTENTPTLLGSVIGH